MVTECIMGGKGGKKGGQRTRWFHSGDPISTARVKKKRGKEKKKQRACQKQEGKKGELYLPLNEPPSFLFTSCAFSLSFLFSFYPKSFSFPSSFFPPSLSLSSSSPHLSYSDMFSKGLPSVDTVSTNSSPPVPRGEPLRKREKPGGGGGGGPPGKACWVQGDTGELEGRS